MRSKTLLVIFGLGFLGCSDSSEPTETKQLAAHPEVSLAGSNFEIDTDANLKVDDGAPSTDWAGVTETRKVDTASGASDESFGQGTKEDTAVPTVVDGGIPPNKSDLLTFGVHLETVGSNKFLHMYWHRVQEPSGTTNMDFEFNQSSVKSANGVTPVRTSGDLLIQYDLAQGGTNPQLFLSRWIDGSETPAKTAADCEASNRLPCWDKKVNLTAAGDATGSINTSAILAGESDGLGPISARTFGEATVDFNAIVGSGTCTSFGSAYLKSRSSDSFTAALKDFIPPASVSISNCGSVKVVKTDDAATPQALAGATFDLRSDLAPAGGSPGAEDTTAASCTTNASGECLFTNVIQGSYWVVETAAPPGHDLASPAYQLVTVTADQTVTVTFVNPRQRGAIKVTKTRKHAASGAGNHPHAGVSFTVNGVTKQTDANGVACFDNLLFGTYSVTETVPTGYAGENPKNVTVDNKATCADSPYVGETVSFSNTPLSDIACTFSSQVPGGTAAKISCSGANGALTADPADSTPNAFDDTSEAFKNLVPGTYTCTIVVDP